MSDELSNIQELELYPAWRQALVSFRSAGFAHDTIVVHEWFYDAFGIEMPGEQTPLKVAEKAKLQWLGQFTNLKSALLNQDAVDLVNEPGLGYRVMPPREQAARAYSDGNAAIKKAITNMVDRSTHTNLAAMTTDERRAHMDTLGRIGMLKGMFRQRRALPEE